MINGKQRQPSLLNKRLGWILAAFLLLSICLYLLLSDIYVIQAKADNDDILIEKRINTNATISSRYIHSVAKCPIIENYVVNDSYQMVLIESWNCSFGAGIETEPPPGATDRLEDGFYVIDNINQTFSRVLFHPVDIAEQTLTIDGETWEISKEPFVGRTFSLEINKVRFITYFWRRFSF